MFEYQGKTVTVVRKAQQGDKGFDAAKDQTLIQLADGTEKVVPTSDVTEVKHIQTSAEIAQSIRDSVDNPEKLIALAASIDAPTLAADTPAEPKRSARQSR